MSPPCRGYCTGSSGGPRGRSAVWRRGPQPGGRCRVRPLSDPLPPGSGAAARPAHPGAVPALSLPRPCPVPAPSAPGAALSGRAHPPAVRPARPNGMSRRGAAAKTGGSRSVPDAAPGPMVGRRRPGLCCPAFSGPLRPSANRSAPGLPCQGGRAGADGAQRSRRVAPVKHRPKGGRRQPGSTVPAVRPSPNRRAPGPTCPGPSRGGWGSADGAQR